MTGWRGWDGEDVVVRHDRETGAWIVIAIHSTALGPAAGGTRLHQYASFDDALADAFRLSEHMSYKFALAGLPRGGAKAVIAAPSAMRGADREGLFRRYGELLRSHPNFTTATDLGTSAADMDIINAVAPGAAAADTSDDSDSRFGNFARTPRRSTIRDVYCAT